MSDLIKQIRLVHWSLVALCVALLLAASDPRSPLDESRRELDQVVRIIDWLDEGWFSTSTLRQLGVATPESVPVAVAVVAAMATEPYSSFPVHFRRLWFPSTSVEAIDRPTTGSLADFFAFWRLTNQPVPARVFVEPDYQARRHAGTGRYLANDGWVEPLVQDPYDLAIWIDPPGGSVDGVEIEFLFDSRPPTHNVIIELDAIEPGRFVGQVRAFEEYQGEMPFFLSGSYDAGHGSGRLEHSGFKLVFTAGWRDATVIPQRRILSEFPDVVAGNPERSFGAVHALAMDLEGIEIDQLDAFLRILAREARSEDSFTAFGLELPIDQMLLWAVPLIVVVQIYLASYLRELATRFETQGASEEIVWIGVFEHWFARAITVTTLCLLPTTVLAIFVWRLYGAASGTEAVLVVVIAACGLVAAIASVVLLVRTWSARRRRL